MRNLTHKWSQLGHFFPKLGNFFQTFEKGQRRTPPHSPLSPLVTCLLPVTENTFHIFACQRPENSLLTPIVNYGKFFFSIMVTFIDTDDSQDSKGREGNGPFFIPLYHFHPLTNIETFVWNFACEMTITYF